MSTRNKKRQPLLRYWTSRYLVTLFLGLLLVGLFSTVWIREQAVRRRLAALRLLAATLAENAAGPQGSLVIDPHLPEEIERSRRLLGLGAGLILFIADHHHQIVFSFPGLPTLELPPRLNLPSAPGPALPPLPSGGYFHLVKQEISYEKQRIGTIYLIYPRQGINQNPEAIELLLFMLGSLAVLGWLIIYLLTRRLAKPIHQVAAAARRIIEGDYRLTLPENLREQELDELIQAFKTMAARLKQLEALRAELLAQLSHELKTPVTIIGGLLQALRDQVVTGDEAREFLELAHQETAHLQRMIEDLLDFNAFLTGALPVEKRPVSLNPLIAEMITQWLRGQEKEGITINTRLPAGKLRLATDPLRLRQILYNLLNNAKQAYPGGGKVEIEVILREKDKAIEIEIKDNGPGIPPAEQELIFERFFRGHAKKNRVRGLGLGLPFSKLIAQALGGDLRLKETSARGTTFILTLPK